MCIAESVLLFLAKIVEIDVAEVGTQNNEICSLWPIYLPHSYVFYIFACLYMLLAHGG